MQRFVLVLIIVISLILQGCSGIEEQRVVGDGEFKLRISRWLVSWQIFMPQSTYLIETSTGNEDWINAHSWTQDDPWKVSEIDLKVLTPSVGYFFNASEYGVTVDAGKSWRVFKAYETMVADGTDEIRKTFSRGVPRVIINEDGTGSLYVQAYRYTNGPKRDVYFTKDFGQSWQLVPQVLTKF